MTAGAFSEELSSSIRSFLVTENLYHSAIREISTKLENLNDEFKCTRDRNPIHNITARVKSPKSIQEKLERRGLATTLESAQKNLSDIAGVRVICSYIDDIYLIAELLCSQSDVKLIRRSDYIKHPKPSGYRSLHLIVTVPVFLSDRTEIVSVEVQVRTIAMDFWASLQHELGYRLSGEKAESIAGELKACADIISDTDQRMQALHDIIYR